MDFTEVYPVASGSKDLVVFSPGGHFILSAVQDRLIVRRADTLQITRHWKLNLSATATNTVLPQKGQASSNSLETQITQIGWSADSEYLLGVCSRLGIVHVFKMRDENWNCQVDAGTEGLVKAEWAPDGRHILCFSQWGLRVTIWSLVTGTATYIQFPSHSEANHQFSHDGRYLFTAERHRSKDSIGIYDALDAYKLVRNCSVPTSNLGAISLSPNGLYLAIWEGVLEVVILSISGTVLATFLPPLDPGLGIKGVRWHPQSSFIAVLGYDDKIHILDSVSWSSIYTIEPVSRTPSNINVWREPSQWMETTEGRGFLSYEKLHGSTAVSLAKADPAKPNPKGNGLDMSWNCTRNNVLCPICAPRFCWIYDFPSPRDSFAPRIRSLLMHDHHCEADSTEETAECIGVPAKEFEVRSIQWGPDGHSLILVGKGGFCCAFEVENE
ncbi:hypothetical protein DL96DRAFT_1573605 [Flagelloscypha sp. PMI_526]|nr:hypothetical protein DL96DRAFT_1573605 [Flagelloscypha sp. PMI_526]